MRCKIGSGRFKLNILFYLSCVVITVLSGCANANSRLIKDANLDASIRDAIGKSEGELTISDLSELDKIVAKSSGIESLEGLQYCTNLTHLSITSTNASDLEPLRQLHKLEILILSNNNISDISPIKNLINLKTLSLIDNNISDLTPLSQLTKLVNLALHTNNIVDITPLEILGELEFLSLGHNNIIDISPLVRNEGLNNGDEINIANNPLSDTALNVQVPELESRGVLVIIDWGV